VDTVNPRVVSPQTAEVDERFAALDALIRATDERLQVIAVQNARLGEMQ
jgi:hypothetical protein